MKITEFKIKNFRGIKEMNLLLNPQLNVFCGINGAGKSSILDSAALLLSWIIARIRQERGSGSPIGKYDINNYASSALLEMTLSAHNVHYKGSLAKTRSSGPSFYRSDMKEFSNYAKQMQQEISDPGQDTSLPVLVFYNTNRSVTDIPLRIRGRHEFRLLETYDGALGSGVNFRSFFEWYRNREDLENESRRDRGKFVPDKQLEAVRSSINLLTGFSHIRIKRNPLYMEVSKKGEHLRVNQLSDGEKCLFAMAGDLARRLAIANPGKKNPLHGEGIVLIDELDLHLHPQWQKKIIPTLLNTFPNIQFLVSTHSPQILSEVPGSNIFIFYQKEKEGITYYKPKQGKGLDSNNILKELMDTSPINEEVRKKLDEIFNAIDEHQFDVAEDAISHFEEVYGSIPELVRARALLTMYSEDVRE